ncbi:MAG: hypothetical protein AVDCRST_MAG59-3473 [uncultured Thermomicrobiales bacterium]|uniref:Uncharacterized protein n=1 Tax=uncultured Thermomicrobiales bacterium TaxID=1645740 RepID=A0A6J4V6Z9_9BACT|nr:MAG: hypothetical protein AVDCRST_MAG59-3473 [uncultured Thermomicrobiales bacterium]
MQPAAAGRASWFRGLASLWSWPDAPTTPPDTSSRTILGRPERRQLRP